MEYIIIGDGVAGHTAAATIQEHDPDAQIHVFTAEQHPFYDRIGLRDYIRSGRNEQELMLNDTDWYLEQDIELHLSTRIQAIDRDEQRVVTAAGEEYAYDRLLLAVGGTPRTIPIEESISHIHHLWTLEEHGKPLRRDLTDADHGVVIGGGLLGFDLVGSFAQTDTKTTYLIREQHWWPSVLDDDGAAIVHEAMQEDGVDLRLEEKVQSFEGGDAVTVMTDQQEYTVDVVGMAIGHRRNTKLAEDAGLDTDRGIICNEHLQTSDPTIYVAGDVAEYRDVVLEKQHLGGSWITAQEQGAVAGKNMAGEAEELRFVDTYTVTHFGVNVAALGDPRHTDGHRVVTAMDEDGRRYRKLVIEDGRIVGAAIIGEMTWLHPLKQLILQKTDVSAVTGLDDPAFDLKQLL